MGTLKWGTTVKVGERMGMVICQDRWMVHVMYVGHNKATVVAASEITMVAS